MDNINFDNLAELPAEGLAAIASIPADKLGLVYHAIIQKIKAEAELTKTLKADHDIIVEKLAKLEGENDQLKGRVDRIEKALLKSIEQIAQHTHDTMGRASVPLIA